MIKKYFSLSSVDYILKLRKSIIDSNYIRKDETIQIDNFLEETLLYISFYGIDEIRIILNILINFLFDNFLHELKKCNQKTIFQFIKIMNYYPHLSKIEINDNEMDIIDYLNIELRRYGDKYLTDKQLDLYKKVLSKDQIIYSAPTSYGKTMICLDGFMYLFKKKQIKKLLLIVPTKSLINEYKNNIIKKIQKYEISINIVESAYASFSNENTIYIFTQERVLAFFNEFERVKSIDYILVDEAQSIATIKNKRTLLLLKALSLFKYCPKIYLTPFVKNFNENVVKKIDNSTFDEVVVTGEESIVANNKFIVDLTKNKDVYVTDVTFDSVNPNVVIQYGKRYEADDNFEFLNTLELLKNKKIQTEQNIIFCSNVNNTMEWPKLLMKEIYTYDKEISKREKALIKHLENNIHKKFKLIEYLKNGIAFHNSYLDSFTKRQLEIIFTEKESNIKYLFCTSTIAQGVNLSAKNIYVFVKKLCSENSNVDFINMLGRTARFKYNSLGNLYYVKTANHSKYEKLFLNSNNNLNIELSKIKADDIAKEGNIEFRSYLSDINIENAEKSKILSDNKSQIEKINLIPQNINQMNYSIEQSEIGKIEKVISDLPEQDIKKFLKFYTSYDSTYEFISFLCNTYNWENIYRKEKRKKRILNIEFIATIITNLIQGYTINNMINYNIRNNKYKKLYVNVKDKIISYHNDQFSTLFDENNSEHINIMIINSLFDVQNIIEFDVKKYIQDFYYRANKLHNIFFNDESFENFIDFSTIDKPKIKLMNLGIIDSFAINEIIKNRNYKDIIDKSQIDLNDLLKRVEKIAGDESPLYYAIKDVIN